VIRAATENTAVRRLASMENVDPRKRRGREDPVCTCHLDHHLQQHPPISALPSPCELTADKDVPYNWSPGTATATCFHMISLASQPLHSSYSLLITQLKQLV